MFSLRIVNVDFYQSAPTKGYDICYSEFRGCEIYKVPIIRIFGITPAGQKGCLHVHGVFPYFSIRCKDVFPNIEAKSLRKCMQELALDIDKALNVAARNSNSHRHHVYKIVVAEHIPFYGFHENAEEFLKIYFYNPFDVSRTAELMTNGVILNKFIQPYEAHIPYILQFFIDYNLFGMNLINVSKFKFRASEEEIISPLSPRNQSLSLLDDSNTPSNKIWNIGIMSSSQISHLPRQTVCELEIDCCSSEIMNRLNESFSSGKNPGLLAIWEEERQRRIAENDTSVITPVPSQERTDFIETESENFYKKKLRKILESFDVFKVCQKDHASKDMEDLSSPNVSDLSSTQDEEMLNMMLSLANSQSTQLDDDSILGLNHQNEIQNENTEDETIEMSQLFTGELEEIWSSQSQNSESDRNRMSRHNLLEQSFNDNTVIPQLDGANDEDFETDCQLLKKNKKNTPTVIDEETLIKSCTLYQPVVRLTPAEIKTAIRSSVQNTSECSISSKSKEVCSSKRSRKKTSFPVCVPVSKNAHCSLIMHFNENSNDVSIEHTCSNRNSANNNCLAVAEDPSDVVFELLTNLIYKVECITEGKTSCYEHLTEEFQGKSSSDILLSKLNTEEKSVLQQIKTTPSDYKESSPFSEREDYANSNLSLPIKKRIFSNNWNEDVRNQCNSCAQSFPYDLSKIGREVVLIKKLSQSDFIKYIKFNSLKVVIPPLPQNLNITKDITAKKEKENTDFKHRSFNKELKGSCKKNFKLKHSEIHSNEKLPSDVVDSIINENEHNSCDQLPLFQSAEQSSSHKQPELFQSAEQSPSHDQSALLQSAKPSPSHELTLLQSVKQSASHDQLELLQSAKQSPSHDQLTLLQSVKQSASHDQLELLQSAKQSPCDQETLLQSVDQSPPRDQAALFQSAKQSGSSEIPRGESPILNVVSPLSKFSDNESRHDVHLNDSESDCSPEFDESSCQGYTKTSSDSSDPLSIKCNTNIIASPLNTESIDSKSNSKSLVIPDTFESSITQNSPDNSKSYQNQDSLKCEEALDSNLSMNPYCGSSQISHIDSVVPKRSTDIEDPILSPACKDFKNTSSTIIPDIKMHTGIDDNQSCEAKKKSTRSNSNYENSCDKTIDSAASDVGNKKTHDLIITNSENNKIVNSPKAEFENPAEEKKLPTKSELRLYRRKKLPISKELPFFCDESSKNSSHQSDIPTSIGSRVREKNSSDLQIEYIGVGSKPKICESTQICVPVVQLEPCKELIDKYCKNETDSDCLILKEVDKDQKKLPAVKEKRFFRSRARQPKNHNLSSNIVINHKLGLNNSKNKPKKFLPLKRGTGNSVSNSVVQKSSTQILRKRSANFDSPSKKKLQFNANSKCSSFSPEKNSLEQVYDFESHLNADENELDNKYFSRYSQKNKSNNVLKNNISCKLSLKLNRRKNNDVLDEYIPESNVSLNYTPQKILRPRRTSSVVSYNEDEDPLPEENEVLTKIPKQNSAKDIQILSECENSAPGDINSVADSDEISDWSIDDIPASQLHPRGSLKCTISKQRIFASHENEKIPIPKFKVRKKKRSKSLNVSIKLRKTSLDGLDSNPDLVLKKKSYYCVTSKNKKESRKSPKKSHTFASAFDVKLKYKKHKKSRKECLKNAILQYCNSMIKTKSSNQPHLVQTSEPEINHFVEKSDYYKPNIPSYSPNFTSKNEVSSICDSPLTEDNSDDNKKSKNSLKLKLKLKRLTTRSNEERIVVVGKELEGIDEDSDDNEDQQKPSKNDEPTKSLNDFENNKRKESNKTLGAKSIKCDQNDFKLKTKFKCPLLTGNGKLENPFTEMKPEVNKENYKEKIPKFKYKPLLASISSDLLPKNECNVLTSQVLNNVSPHRPAIISPKKKSPLKNAESIKRELAQLNEMACARESPEINIAEPNDFPDIADVNIEMQKKLRDEKGNTLLDISTSNPCKLGDRRSSAEYKKQTRRNSLLCQDFKKDFDSNVEEDAIKVISPEKKSIEKFDSGLPDSNSIKPCSIDIEKLSASEVEKYICNPVVNLQKSEIAIPYDPAIASFPSPIVETKSVDSYIDPRRVFKNLFTFPSPSPSHSPVHFNTFETSSLIIENDMSCGPFSNESSEHSRKEFPKANDLAQNPLKPNDVFKSVEREDMGVLWNLAYLSPPQANLQDVNNAPASVIRKKVKNNNDQKYNSTLIDELQKLAKQADEVCSLSCNIMNSENSLSMVNDKALKVNYESSMCSKESKISFENILEKNINKVLDDLENIPSFSQAPIEFEEKQMIDKKSETLSTDTEMATLIKEEPKSDPVFEPMESLPNVRILDFQECLVESDSEMNPLLNDSEIDSVMSSADMLLANSVDLQNYEHCLQTDLTFDDPISNSTAKPKCVPEEPKSDEIDDLFCKSAFDPPLQKQLDTDLTCNDAIITAADTSSLLIPSFKSNTIPVLAINNPCQEATVNFAALEEQNFSANGQFFPVMLAPVSVAENPDYLENSSVVKENVSDPQECVNFLEDNELLQSCSVSSTSDIENKNAQASNPLNIPFNGEEDILSMIVKSCDIGEEFDINVNSVEETETESISSATLCNTLVDSNYVMAGSNFIISSQPEQNTLQTNSENAVSSSSENNLLQKNHDIVVIKTEPVDVPAVEHILYEIPDKDLNLSHAKSFKPSEEVGNEDNVLLDSMIHSFYGDVSLVCPTFQNNAFSQVNEKYPVETNSSFKSSAVKIDDNALEINTYKSDGYFKNLSMLQNDSYQLKASTSDNKVPLDMLSNSLMLARSFPKVSSKRFHFTPCFRPPTRESFENSVIKTEIENTVKLNIPTEEDSLSSNSSLGSQTIRNDASESNKSLSEVNDHPSSQNSQIKNKSTIHHTVCLNSPIVYHDRTTSNVSFNHLLASTPSTSNIKKEFSLSNVIVSPINKDTGLTADTSKRKRKLVFEDESDTPLKLLKSEKGKMHDIYKYGRKGSLNKSVDSLGNLSYSQIDGPTLENSRGFKVCSENYGDAQIRHEVQHLTVMSLEIHVNTRNGLRPDPRFDSVTAIFYCIYNDVGINEEELVGMIVVDPVSHNSSGQNSTETLKNYLLLCPGVKNGFIYCVENEISLFEKLVRIIREWDPDILTGYEIQMSSWGYLIERGDFLNINLRLQLSRLIDRNEAKIFPVDHDPTVADQTADISRLNIVGRIVLCVWRLMRKEITLNVYSFENVYYHVLHKRTPLYSFHDLTNWFQGSQKEKVIRYYVIRVQGCVHLLEKLDVIGRTSELARLFGIQFYEVLSRGSQYRVESMMLRSAAPMSYIPVSPSVRQRSHSKAPECIPLILEPESRFYVDPVVVLDFQSLYPSMIIAYNYCFSTCLGRVEHFGKNVPFEFGCTSLSVPITLLQKLQNNIHISPTGIAFVKSSVRRGILPSMLEEILNTRIMVKQSMKKIKDNNALKRLLDARQLGLKLIANVTYGYTGASFSGRMPSVEVADSIVGKGRETLERAIHMIENTSKWRAKVIYGDTDSLFILLPGRTKKQAFEIGQEIADAVTADNPKPVKLKFEKVYLPCVLQTKKRYVGFMYETVDQENPVFDAKGIETVRRDSCPATAKVLEKSLKILFKSYDVSLVKNYVQKQFSKLLGGRANIIDCIFAKEYRGISGYRPGACVPALEIAKKRLAKDPRSEPRVGERVPYVVVCGFPGLPIIQLVREPIELLNDVNLRINAEYYITRVISPPLERVFNLLGADVKSWYTTLARTFKPTLPMTRTTNQHRGTLSQYFVTLSCPSCDKPTFSTVCDDCREDLQGTTIAINEKIRQWERTVDHLTQICGSCTKSGSSIDSCISLDCPMLFKLNAAKKDLSQAPYLRKVLAHELF